MIELMVVIAIIAIMLAVAVPGFGYWQAKNDATYMTDLLYRQLQGAREHAINQNQNVTLCGVNANKECVGSDFTSLVMFVDVNGDKEIDTGEDSTETVISESGIQKPKGTVTLNITAKAVVFKPDGTAIAYGSFIYCPSNNSYTQLKQKITVSPAGRPFIGEAATTDCATN